MKADFSKFFEMSSNFFEVPSDPEAFFKEVAEALALNELSTFIVCMRANFIYNIMGRDQSLQEKQYKQWVQCLAFIIRNKSNLKITPQIGTTCIIRCLEILGDKSVFPEEKMTARDHDNFKLAQAALQDASNKSLFEINFKEMCQAATLAFQAAMQASKENEEKQFDQCILHCEQAIRFFNTALKNCKAEQQKRFAIDLFHFHLLLSRVYQIIGNQGKEAEHDTKREQLVTTYNIDAIPAVSFEEQPQQSQRENGDDANVSDVKDAPLPKTQKGMSQQPPAANSENVKAKQFGVPKFNMRVRVVTPLDAAEGYFKQGILSLTTDLKIEFFHMADSWYLDATGLQAEHYKHWIRCLAVICQEAEKEHNDDLIMLCGERCITLMEKYLPDAKKDGQDRRHLSEVIVFLSAVLQRKAASNEMQVQEEVNRLRNLIAPLIPKAGTAKSKDPKAATQQTTVPVLAEATAKVATQTPEDKLSDQAKLELAEKAFLNAERAYAEMNEVKVLVDFFMQANGLYSAVKPQFLQKQHYKNWVLCLYRLHYIYLDIKRYSQAAVYAEACMRLLNQHEIFVETDRDDEHHRKLYYCKRIRFVARRLSVIHRVEWIIEEFDPLSKIKALTADEQLEMKRNRDCLVREIEEYAVKILGQAQEQHRLKQYAASIETCKRTIRFLDIVLREASQKQWVAADYKNMLNDVIGYFCTIIALSYEKSGQMDIAKPSHIELAKLHFRNTGKNPDKAFAAMRKKVESIVSGLGSKKSGKKDEKQSDPKQAGSPSNGAAQVADSHVKKKAKRKAKKQEDLLAEVKAINDFSVAGVEETFVILQTTASNIEVLLKELKDSNPYVGRLNAVKEAAESKFQSLALGLRANIQRKEKDKFFPQDSVTPKDKEAKLSKAQAKLLDPENLRGFITKQESFVADRTKVSAELESAQKELNVLEQEVTQLIAKPLKTTIQEYELPKVLERKESLQVKIKALDEDVKGCISSKVEDKVPELVLDFKSFEAKYKELSDRRAAVDSKGQKINVPTLSTVDTLPLFRLKHAVTAYKNRHVLEQDKIQKLTEIAEDFVKIQNELHELHKRKLEELIVKLENERARLSHELNNNEFAGLVEQINNSKRGRVALLDEKDHAMVTSIADHEKEFKASKDAFEQQKAQFAKGWQEFRAKNLANYPKDLAAWKTIYANFQVCYAAQRNVNQDFKQAIEKFKNFTQKELRNYATGLGAKLDYKQHQVQREEAERVLRDQAQREMEQARKRAEQEQTQRIWEEQQLQQALQNQQPAYSSFGYTQQLMLKTDPRALIPTAIQPALYGSLAPVPSISHHFTQVVLVQNQLALVQSPPAHGHQPQDDEPDAAPQPSQPDADSLPQQPRRQLPRSQFPRLRS